MKSIVAISLFLTLVIGCQKEAQIGILIDLNGTFKDTLYLSYLKNSFEVSDTATLRKDGVYYFNLRHKPYGCYKLITDSLHSFELVVDCDTLIKINATYNNFANATFSGSKSTKLTKEAATISNYFENDIDTLLFNWQITNPNDLPLVKRDSLIKQIETIRQSYKILTDSLIDINPGSFANIFIMNGKPKDISLYNIVNDYERYNQIANAILSNYPNNETALGYQQNLIILQKTVEKINKLKVGKSMPLVEIKINDSTFVNLTTLNIHKKALFIQSYQTDLNIHHAHLPMTQALKQKGYEIFEAYIDSVPQTQNLNWTKGTLSQPQNYFFDLPIPMYFLLDENNQIVFQTPFLSDLKEQIPNL